MILPDVNILVFAFRREAPEHGRAARWLNDVARTDGLALTEAVLTGVVRIVTHPRIFASPDSAATATAYVRALLRAPRSTAIGATAATWDAFARIAEQDAGVRGNLVPDAWLAALALSHGCRLATSDRGFARFDGLRLVDPLT